MSAEIEAQVLISDYDDIMKKLKKYDVKKKFDWVKFKIAVFNPCMSIEEQKEKYSTIFTRVRDEGLGTVTITTKTKLKVADSGKFVNEYEIETKNTFEECKELLLANHLHLKAYQERLRQKWIIPDRPEIKEIVFDIWPGLPMYMEIEATSEKELISFLKELDITEENIRYSNVSGLYDEILGIPPDTINQKTPLLDFYTVDTKLKNVVSDVDKFNKIVTKQRELLKKIGFESLLKGSGKSKKKPSRKVSRKSTKKSTRKSNQSKKKPSRKVSRKSTRKSTRKSNQSKKKPSRKSTRKL